MLAFLVLHISALLLWAATLLYLPTLIVGQQMGRLELDRLKDKEDSLARRVFTLAATPAALLAIIFGTVVFVLNRTQVWWLIAKLTLVVALVVCHALTGWLILRAEAGCVQYPARWRAALLTADLLLMGAIVWLVLAKPETPEWLLNQFDRWEA